MSGLISKKPLMCRIGFHNFFEMNDASELFHVHLYKECLACGKRTVSSAATGYQPLRTAWLAGGEWDDDHGITPPTSARKSIPVMTIGDPSTKAPSGS